MIYIQSSQWSVEISFSHFWGWIKAREAVAGKGVVRILAFLPRQVDVSCSRDQSLCSLAIQNKFTLPVSSGKLGITVWISSDKEPGTREIGKVDIFSCILCSSLSYIIPLISCFLFLVIIIISSKLTYEMMELEDFILFFLDTFGNWIPSWMMARSMGFVKS